jgi:hypothetical protein
MTGLSNYLFALFLAAVLAWQLASGTALGAWWYPRIRRRDRPVAFWLMVAAQGAILTAFLVSGKSWHHR